MIISQHKLLGISLSRFAKHHQLLSNIFNDHIYITDLHTIIDNGLPRINLQGLNFILLFLDVIFLLRRMRLGRSLLRPV